MPNHSNHSITYYIDDTIQQVHTVLGEHVSCNVSNSFHPLVKSTGWKTPFQVDIVLKDIKFVACRQISTVADMDYSDVYVCMSVASQQILHDSPYMGYGTITRSRIEFLHLLRDYVPRIFIQLISFTYFTIIVPRVCELYFKIEHELTRLPLYVATSSLKPNK